MTSVQLRDVAWSSPVIERIVRLVGDRTGLVFSQTRHQNIEATIRREADRVGCSQLADYHEMLRADAAAVDSLAAELTIGETYFYRDPAQFDLLRTEILPSFLAADDTIRMWSAGCASGEEPYSVAILCHELGIARRAKILGTDLSRERLRAAREARYGRWSLRGVPDAVITAYFSRRDTRYDLIGRIREMVDFRYLNLAEVGQPGAPAAPGQMDVIICRNVLIYFDAATTARVVRHLVGALTQRGWLLLGASDPPITDYVDCEVVVTQAGLAYQRAASPRVKTVAMEPHPTHTQTVPTFAATASQTTADLHDAPPRTVEAEPLRELLARVVEAHAHGRESEAAALAADFIERGGDELTAWVIRVRALANAGSLVAAGQVCSAALDLHPLSAELTYLQALLLRQAGQYAEAADIARRALYLDRTLAVAHLALGDSLLRLGAGRGPDAARAFRSAHRLLAQMESDAIVPASGGERNARLLATVAARLQLMESMS